MVINRKTHRATQDENATNEVCATKHKNWKKVAGVAIASAAIFVCGLISLHGNIAHADTISQLQQENQEYEEAMNGTYNKFLLGSAAKLLNPMDWAPGGSSNSANGQLTADEVMDWIYAQPALNLLNKFREEHGLKPVKFSIADSILAYRVALQQSNTHMCDQNEQDMGDYFSNKYSISLGVEGMMGEYSNNFQHQLPQNVYYINNHNSIVAEQLYNAMGAWLSEYPDWVKADYDMEHHLPLTGDLTNPDNWGHVEELLNPYMTSMGINMTPNGIVECTNNDGAYDDSNPMSPILSDKKVMSSNQLEQIDKQYQQITNSGYITDQPIKSSECKSPKVMQTETNWKITPGDPYATKDGTYQQNINSGSMQEAYCDVTYTKADYQKMIQANNEKIDQLEGKDPKVSATKPVKKELDKDKQQAKKVADQKKEAKEQTPDKVTEPKPAKPEPKATPKLAPAPATAPAPAKSEPSAPTSSSNSSSSSADTQSSQSTPTYTPTSSSSDSSSDSTPSYTPEQSTPTYTPAPVQSAPAPSTTNNSGTYPVPQNNGQSTVTHTTPDTSVHTTNSGKPVSNPYGNRWKVSTQEYNSSNSPLPQALW